MIENENKALSNDEQHEAYDHAINTATIYSNETRFRKDPEFFNCKKCPDEIARDLEHIIQELLVKYVEPTVDYSDHQREYLITRFKKFNKAHFTIEPFRTDFFVTAYDKPRNEKGNNPLSFTGDNYYYLYSYQTPFLVHKKTITDYQFELLFAFALRHCDLMHIHSFLHFHLMNNFEGKPKQYCQYLTQTNRKFGSTLFTTELSDSIKDWILENESKVSAPASRKIKTYLTVDQLAFLFRALVDNGHLSDENKNTIIAWACENFESKMKTEISKNSFDQKFYAPTDDALDFWVDNFDKLHKLAVRMKQKKET
jgi:hypothetical protein